MRNGAHPPPDARVCGPLHACSEVMGVGRQAKWARARRARPCGPGGGLSACRARAIPHDARVQRSVPGSSWRAPVMCRQGRAAARAAAVPVAGGPVVVMEVAARRQNHRSRSCGSNRDSSAWHVVGHPVKAGVKGASHLSYAKRWFNDYTAAHQHIVVGCPPSFHL